MKQSKLKQLRFLLTILTITFLGGCAKDMTELKTVDYVDINLFMGSWYVIANIPTFLEKDIYEAIETYSLNDDGTIGTVFNFKRGGFEGALKEYNPKGFIVDKDTNALWGMQFIWPIKADYRIVYVDNNYSKTIIARQKRDFVWIMSKTPTISESEYDELTSFVESIGYDISLLQRIPQVQ